MSTTFQEKVEIEFATGEVTNMNLLVTGGAGFIGSNLIDRLLNDGHTVVCIDNFDDYYAPSIKEQNILRVQSNNRFSLVRGDIRDTSAVAKCFSDVSIDTVIHLAARAGVRPSLINPELYYDVNVIGTLRLLEAMKKWNVGRLIFGSSSSVYGNNNKIPFSETDSVDKPVSPYAASKKAGELLCHTYHELYKFDVYCLRFFTVYGPRQRPEMAIHYFVKKILAGERITLFGDGSSQRDYTFIDDILDGVTKCLNNLRGYEIINLGESQTISLIDLIAVIENLTGKKSFIDWKPMQLGDVTRTYADIAKAKKILGYNPQYHVTDGIKKFIEWYQNSGLNK
jgi:UDP-glucuronate 4-epimerase